MTTAGAGAGISPRLRGRAEPASTGSRAGERGPRRFLRWTWWAALPFGLLYLILLAHQLDTAIRITNLDADAASGPVIGELFGAAPAHANVVLGTFAWYSTLLFDLATKWLPYHRTVWEAAPYAMAVAGAALTAWSVSQVASRWAAGLTAVLLISTSPATLRVELATTQHAPTWFCLALLGAFAVWLERRRVTRWPVLIVLVVVVGTIVGVNAASDPLLDIAGLAPFGLALIATRVLVPGRDSTRAMWSGLATLAVTGVTWAITALVMSALSVAREPGLHTTRVVVGHKNLHNFTLWWKSIATLGNGDYFGHALSPASRPRVRVRRDHHRRGDLDPLAELAATAPALARAGGPREDRVLRLLVLVGDPALARVPVQRRSRRHLIPARYLVGLLYAAAAVVPAAAAGRVLDQGDRAGGNLRVRARGGGVHRRARPGARARGPTPR